LKVKTHTTKKKSKHILPETWIQNDGKKPIVVKQILTMVDTVARKDDLMMTGRVTTKKK
jgi:hypothetical protein